MNDLPLMRKATVTSPLSEAYEFLTIARAMGLKNVRIGNIHLLG